MGALTIIENQGAALFGRTRRTVLGILFGHPEQTFYLREIVRMAGMGQGTVQRELAQLTAAGLLTRRQHGHQVFFQANSKSPVFSELKSLVMKTAGMAGVLQEALRPLAKKIVTAFIHGSMARQAGRANSDIDMIVVGKVSFAELSGALTKAQEKLRREVNPIVYSGREFSQKLRAKHHFLMSVLTKPRVFLVGDERDLERLGAKRLAH